MERVDRINRFIVRNNLDYSFGSSCLGVGGVEAYRFFHSGNDVHAYIASSEIAIGLALTSHRAVAKEISFRRATKFEIDFGTRWFDLKLWLAWATYAYSDYLSAQSDPSTDMAQRRSGRWQGLPDAKDILESRMTGIKTRIEEANATDFLEAKPVRDVSDEGELLESYTMKLVPKKRFGNWSMRTEETVFIDHNGAKFESVKVILEKPPKAA